MCAAFKCNIYTFELNKNECETLFLRSTAVAIGRQEHLRSRKKPYDQISNKHQEVKKGKDFQGAEQELDLLHMGSKSHMLRCLQT